MEYSGSIIPPRGSNPVEAFLSPPQESLLIDSSLSSIKPQTHTTILGSSVFHTNDHQTPLPTFLPPSAPSRSDVPHVSILPEGSIAQGIPPQSHTSILTPGLYAPIPPQKLPNLVRPMPSKH
ncbi:MULTISPECIES: hypothetical protein [unclassified Leptolyngbya]|uniref:hypothetical protein n=1 Tax=unclassified Leptolyngbya TaxID=2650499 RepID=UPI001686F6F5|nr:MULTISPECIES: hypothetical protein [unclassified Leptolyngbya]MBD1911587.1 hypothetical protein [Leptolyngbya sp. FACHB-8]MBD2157851.1 hypothetical protein [Leptolyngbya sp. FACHB-16]